MALNTTLNTLNDVNLIKVIGVPVVGFSFAELITNPVNVVRVVYQTENLTLRQTIENVHVRQAYFNGFLIALASKVVSNSLKYVLYDRIKDYRGTKKDNLVGNMLNGVIGGVIGTSVTNPLMVWRTRRQRGDAMNLRYSFDGYKISVIRCIPLYGLLFPCRDWYHNFYTNKFGNFIWVGVLASVTTNITTLLVVHPFDYVRTRLAARKPMEYTLNPIKYYRGAHIAFARNMPHFVISMLVMDMLKKHLDL